jgi:hypothetical protein
MKLGLARQQPLMPSSCSSNRPRGGYGSRNGRSAGRASGGECCLGPASHQPEHEEQISKQEQRQEYSVHFPTSPRHLCSGQVPKGALPNCRPTPVRLSGSTVLPSPDGLKKRRRAGRLSRATLGRCAAGGFLPQLMLNLLAQLAQFIDGSLQLLVALAALTLAAV